MPAPGFDRAPPPAELRIVIPLVVDSRVLERYAGTDGLTPVAWGSNLDTELLYKASTWILPILVAITFHEAAHAFAAWKLGDDTAHRLGRVTFNPVKHIDPVGTVLLPGILLFTGAPFLFGWAKPVPVASGRLANPRRDMALVAIAGPLTNIVLALSSALLIHAAWLLPVSVAPWTLQMLYQSILLNLVLAVFNMIPLPPLDGSRILMSFLPAVLADNMRSSSVLACSSSSVS